MQPIVKTQKAETGERTGEIVSCAGISNPEERIHVWLLKIKLLSYGFFTFAVYMLRRNP